MSQEVNKNLECLSTEIQQCFKSKRFDIKTIQTLGVFRSSQLQSFKHMKIREESFKELLTKSLKLCYLYEPILKTLQEMQNTSQLEYQNPNNLLKVNSILKILCESLFYRNMFKLKIDSYDSVINLVNNRSTEINRKVIIAGLVVYAAKKLTLEEIGAAMLIFNLEEALLKLRPYGLPLEQLSLQKCIKKLQRIININDLKNFILTVKEQSRAEPITPEKLEILEQAEILPYQNFLGPDQFLYLVALSQKKATSTLIFFQNYSKGQSKSHLTTSQGIDAFMRQKKVDFINGQDSGNGQAKEDRDKNIEAVENNPNTSYDKIQGLQLHSNEESCIKALENSANIYKEIKSYLSETKPELIMGRKAKSLKLQTEMSKNSRPATAIFKKSIQILDRNKTNYGGLLGNQLGKENARRLDQNIDRKHRSFYKTASNQEEGKSSFQNSRIRSQSIANSEHTNAGSFKETLILRRLRNSPSKQAGKKHSVSSNLQLSKRKPEKQFSALAAATRPAMKKHSISNFKERGHLQADKKHELRLHANCNRDSIEDSKVEWFEVQKGKVFYDYEDM